MIARYYARRSGFVPDGFREQWWKARYIVWSFGLGVLESSKAETSTVYGKAYQGAYERGRRLGGLIRL